MKLEFTTMPVHVAVAEVVGAATDEDWDEIYGESYWLRVQPRGLGLHHRSECSDGSLAAGLHVHKTLAQAVTQDGRWQMRGFEIVVIAGPETLRDTGDVEGWLLPEGEGEIVARFDFDRACEEFYAHEEEN